MPKVTPAHEQKRREQILEAAMVCFARQGYRATSMEDIVRESGLSVGAIYTYFPSKEDLFLALADQRKDQTLSYLRELFRRPGAMAGKMAEAIDFFFDQLAEDHTQLARVSFEFWSESSKSERLHARQCERLDTIRQFFLWMLGEAKRQGELRADVDVASATALLMALNDGLFMHHVQGVQSVPREALKAAYVSLVNRWLANPRQPFLVDGKSMSEPAAVEAGAPTDSAAPAHSGSR